MEKAERAEIKSRGRVRFIVLNSMRIILLVALFLGWNWQRYLILTVSLIGLLVTFLPAIFARVFKTELPASFEIITLLFVYGILYVGEVRGIYEQFWIVGFLLRLLASVIFGFVGLAVAYALYKQEKVRGPPVAIAFFAFCFAVSVGALWEVFEFVLDNTLGFRLQKGGFDIMKDLISYFVGASIVAIAGYVYLKRGRINLISALVEKVVERNAPKWGIAAHPEQMRARIKTLINEGEAHKTEFKSTLRTNVHTGQADKIVEHAALKTMAGYLNSDGGTLLIGVDDSKQIVGIDKDNFPSHDKMGLYLTNLIKEHIGAEFLPLINFEIVEIDGKHLLKIDCGKSDKEVFFKAGKDEHFYVRNGPSTATLSGSALVDYISRRFR